VEEASVESLDQDLHSLSHSRKKKTCEGVCGIQEQSEEQIEDFNQEER
jgi:hypothetical protein